MKNNRYKFYNRRPDGALLEDCVCRAISTATGLKYGAVENLLTLTAEKEACDKLCVCCYHHLLEDVLLYPVFYCDGSETVRDITEEYPTQKIIIRISGHLTSAIYGTVLDIWDCTGKPVDCFWIVQ